MLRVPLIFGYVGPESVLPLTSLLATVGAFVMLFGKSLLRFVAYRMRRTTFRRLRGQAATGPHFGLGRRRRRKTSEVKATDRTGRVSE